jgi:hypothetical protein
MVLSVAALDAPTAQPSRLLVFLSSICSFWGNEKTNLRASERDDFTLPFLPLCFFYSGVKKTLPGSGKEQQPLRVSFNLLRCSGKALDKIGITIRRERKSHGFPTSFLVINS